MIKRIFFFTLIIITVFSCKKEENENTNAKLDFSNDTIMFDTIFTSIGSITKTLTVYNNNNFDVLTNINLQEGSPNANFRINIDGTPGSEQSNIKIPANDSIFIFLEVTINPNSTTTPYILTDSLIFITGARKQDVDLVAWGQNAYFHTPNEFGQIINGEDTILFPYHKIDCSVDWTDDKPHVIYGYAIIDPGNTLNINAGCDIHLHKNSGIIVGNPFSEIPGGSIKINGILGNEGTFQGDRLDAWYQDIPGQWDRIWLTPGSIDNEINYAIIRNGNIGIHADTVGNNNPTVIINNTIIENMSSIGILGQGASINANNTLINNCGQYTLACNIGGNYNFTHCTFANHWNYSGRSTPSILLNNYYEDANGNIQLRNLENANFNNCIIDGSLSTEISFQEEESATFNYHFNHCIIKLDPQINTNNSYYTNSIINQPPQFIEYSNNNYHLEEESPAIDSGDPNNSVILDLEGNNRDNYPDIGVFEFQN